MLDPTVNPILVFVVLASVDALTFPAPVPIAYTDWKGITGVPVSTTPLIVPVIEISQPGSRPDESEINVNLTKRTPVSTTPVPNAPIASALPTFSGTSPPPAAASVSHELLLAKYDESKVSYAIA